MQVQSMESTGKCPKTPKVPFYGYIQYDETKKSAKVCDTFFCIKFLDIKKIEENQKEPLVSFLGSVRQKVSDILLVIHFNG